MGAYVSDPEAWLKRFEEAGQPATLRRKRKTVLVSYKPEDFENRGALLQEFLQDALDLNDSSED